MHNGRLILLVWSLFFLDQGYSQIADRNPSEKQWNNYRYHALLFSLDYSSNSNILGNVTPENRQPSFSPSAIYLNPSGVDLSAMYSYVGNSDDSLTGYSSELDLMLGYTLQLFQHLSIYPSYSHYFHSNNSHDVKAMFTDDIRLDADYDYKFVSVGLSAGYYMGKKNTFYAAARNYYLINKDKFIPRRASMIIQPGIDANFGNFEYLNLYYLDELRENSGFYLYLMYNYPVLRRYVKTELLKNPGSTLEEIIDEYLEEEAEDNFKLTSVNLNVPFYYSIGKVGINLGLYLYIPVQQPEYLSNDVQFFINIGLSYELTFH